MSTTGFQANSKTLSGITSLNADTVLVKDLTVSGSITNSEYTQVKANVSSLNTKTTNQSYSSNTTTFAGIVSAGSISGTLTTASQPNITSLGTLSDLSLAGLNIKSGKGSVSLSGCYTIGTEQTNSPITFPSFTFSSNTQNGYTVNGSSIGRYGYPYYYALNNGTFAWWTNQNSYQANGTPSGAYFLNYGSGSVSNGDWVSLRCPNYVVLTNVSFYNSYGFMNGYSFKSVAVFGQYNNSSLFLLGSYTMAGVAPNQGTYSFSVTTTQAYNTFYFQITQGSNQSGGGFSYECAVKNIVFTGTAVNNSINQSVYIPQSLEVGRSLTQNLADTQLSVNGNASVDGDFDVLSNVTVGGNLSVGQAIIGYTSTTVVPVSGQIGYTWKFGFTTQTLVSSTPKLVTNLSIDVGTWIVFCRIGIHNTPSNFCNLTSVQLYLIDSASNIYDNFMDNGTTHATTSTAHFTPQITATIQYVTGRAYGVYVTATHSGTTTNVIFGDDSASQLWAVRIA